MWKYFFCIYPPFLPSGRFCSHELGMRAFNTPEYQSCFNLNFIEINVEFFLLKYFYLGSCCGDQRPVMKTNRKYLIITRQTNCSSAAPPAGPYLRHRWLPRARALSCCSRGRTGTWSAARSGSFSRRACQDINKIKICTNIKISRVLSPVFVESHIPYEQDLAVVYKAGKWTINCK